MRNDGFREAKRILRLSRILSQNVSDNEENLTLDKFLKKQEGKTRFQNLRREDRRRRKGRVSC